MSFHGQFTSMIALLVCVLQLLASASGGTNGIPSPRSLYLKEPGESSSPQRRRRNAAVPTEEMSKSCGKLVDYCSALVPQPDDEEVTALKNACSGCEVLRVASLANWGETQTMHNIIEAKPRTKDELSRLIIQSGGLGLTIRVIGARHSWSPLFPDPNNVALDLSELKCHDGPDIELVTVNGVKAIRAMAGLTLRKLVDFEKEIQYSPETSTLFVAPTVGGVYATGCHGAATQMRPMGDYLLEMRLMDSKGNLRNFSRAEDGDQFLSLATSLGLPGVLYDVTFEVQPRKIFLRRNLFKKLSELTPEYLANIAATSHSVHFLWFPYNSVNFTTAWEIAASNNVSSSDWNPDNDLVWIVQVTEDPNGVVENENDPSIPSFEDILACVMLDETNQDLAKNPFYTPLVLGVYLYMIKQTNSAESFEYTYGAVHWRPLAEGVPMLETEWLIPTDPNQEATYQTLQFLKDRLKRDFDQGHFPINMVNEFRFMRPSQQLMNPANTGENDQYLNGMGVMSVLNTEGYNEFADAYATYVRDVHGALPHWAKMWAGGQETVDKIKTAYNYTAFAAALKEENLDPNLFSNSNLRDIFGIDSPIRPNLKSFLEFLEG